MPHSRRRTAEHLGTIEKQRVANELDVARHHSQIPQQPEHAIHVALDHVFGGNADIARHRRPGRPPAQARRRPSTARNRNRRDPPPHRPPSPAPRTHHTAPPPPPPRPRTTPI